MRTLKKQDMKDYMIAAAIFAQGQSEDTEKAVDMIDEVFRKELEVRLVDPMEIPDDKLICQLAHRAGGGVPKDIEERLKKSGDWDVLVAEKRDWTLLKKPLKKVVKELSKFLDVEIYSYIACCTASTNGNIIPMYVAAHEGKPFVDGDCCGTAMMPHLDEVYRLKEFSSTMAMVTPFNETVIMRGDRFDRIFSIGNYVHQLNASWVTATAWGLATIKEYRRCMVKNICSKLINIGRAVRRAREEGKDPVESFMKAFHENMKKKAYRLFEGVVESFDLRKIGGFVQGDWILKGSRGFKGHTFRVWFDNENRISWLDDQPHVTIPDLNCIVETETCRGLTHFDNDGFRPVSGIYNGKEVTVLGLPADNIWRTEIALEAMKSQLKAFGFDVKYKTIEKVIIDREL